MSTLWRFNLERQFDPCPALVPGRRMLFVMLNPSTATDTVDDPTIRRCRGFAMRESCESMEVVNLFAWRSTKPEGLVDQDGKPTIFERCAWKMALDREPWRIVAAWGDSGPAWLKSMVRERVRWLVADLVDRDRIMHALGTTKSGMPRHPLYLPQRAPLKPWTCPLEVAR